MKKTLVALLVAASGISMSANADVFIDEQAQKQVVADTVASVKEEVATTTKQVAKAKAVVKKEVEPKVLKTRNVVKKIDLKQETSTFEHVGKKTSTQKLTGFSNEVSIKQALEQLVPEDWDINVSDKVNLGKTVSFAGGKTWNDTLETVGKDNFSAVFDWNKKNLIVTPTTLSHKAETITTTEDIGAVKAKTQLIKKPIAKKAVKAKSTASTDKKYTGKTWLLSKNHTLRQNIEMWAKKAGWTVAWNAPDYNVVSNVTLTGNIDDENGPIISILKLYEDSNLPLKVSIMGGNKVISVESRNYLPKDVIDIGKEIY